MELVTGYLQAKFFKFVTLSSAEILPQPKTLTKMLTDRRTDRRAGELMGEYLCFFSFDVFLWGAPHKYGIHSVINPLLRNE